MNQFLFVFVAVFNVFQISPVQAQSFDIRFTNPQCAVYGDKPRNSFCTRSDLPKALANSEGPFQKIVELIRSPANKKITVATMTFSHRDIAKELCQAKKNGVKVEVLLDSGADLTTANEMEKCGVSIIKVGTDENDDQSVDLPERQDRDLHHNKFLLVQQPTKTVLIFATANFSNPGLSINHETWSFVTGKSNSQFVNEHLCLIAGLKEYKNKRSQFKQNLDKCRVSPDQTADIESLFVPADSSKLVKLIESAIAGSSRVLMMSNRYSFDRVTKAFAASKSKDNRAVFDDDLYWGGIQPTADYVNEAVDAKKVLQLEKLIQVRFMETSFGAAQKMHNKFIVLDSMVIVGAGNFTFSGMTSNFENFYVIREPKTVEYFKNQFEYLWNISTERKKMPSVYWDPGVRP